MRRPGAAVYFIITGTVLGILFTVLQLGQYHFVMMHNTFEIYALILAVVFTGVGIWGGAVLVRRRERIVERVVEKEVIVEKWMEKRSSGISRAELIRKTGLSDREAEVLEGIAAGLTNQEIADKLFVSVPTVKTHVSNIFLKLDVNRRTMAVKKARELGLQDI